MTQTNTTDTRQLGQQLVNQQSLLTQNQIQIKNQLTEDKGQNMTHLNDVTKNNGVPTHHFTTQIPQAQGFRNSMSAPPMKLEISLDVPSKQQMPVQNQGCIRIPLHGSKLQTGHYFPNNQVVNAMPPQSKSKESRESKRSSEMKGSNALFRFQQNQKKKFRQNDSQSHDDVDNTSCKSIGQKQHYESVVEGNRNGQILSYSDEQ